jgi:hypothetical protein
MVARAVQVVMQKQPRMLEVLPQLVRSGFCVTSELPLLTRFRSAKN